MTPSALDQGIALLMRNDARQAVPALLEVLDAHPFHGIAHFDLAVAFRLRGDLPSALGHARTATRTASICTSLGLWLPRWPLPAVLPATGIYGSAFLGIGGPPG